MPRSRSAPRAAAQTPLPDLLAKQMDITADYGTGLVYISCVCENLGPGPAYGPFEIAVAVTITYWDEGDELETTLDYFKDFEVPADVTLWGGPRRVFEPPWDQAEAEAEAEADVARPPIESGPFQTEYVTGALELPLLFRDTCTADGRCYATYSQAQFLVDVCYQVPDYNRTNNAYNWPGDFWFMSREPERRRPLVIERTRKRPTA